MGKRDQHVQSVEFPSVGRWEWDLATQTVAVTDGLCEIFGVENGSIQFTKESFFEFLVPADRPKVRDAIESALSGGAPYDVEFQIVRPDGAHRHVRSCGQVIREQGKPRSVVGLAVDFTERAESESRFRILFELAAVGIAEVETATGRLVRVNQRFCDMLGYSAAELEGRTIGQISASDGITMTRDCQRSLEAGQQRDFVSERRLQQRDGSTFWVELTISSMERSERAPGHHIAAIVDITSRKQAEEALRRSEGRFREMADHLREVLWLVDARTGQVIYASPAYETVWGRSLDGLYKNYHQWTDSLLEEDREKTTKALEAALKAGGGKPYEYRIVRPDGEVRWILDRGFAVRDESGEIVRLAGIAEDITARKAEEEARRLLEARIQHTQKLESLGVLAGGIAHDFNNLLTGVIGNTDLALMHLPPGSPARKYMETSYQAARRAAELTNEMLAYSGKGRFVVEPVALDRLVGEILHLLEAVISKDARIECSFADDLPAIQADANQLRQIVMNLITNASESLGDGAGVIRVSTGVSQVDRSYLASCHLGDEVPEGDFVYVRVADTGCGMAEKDRDKIFDPFFTTKFTGRGLGLAAVLGIVRGHQGAIRLESKTGQGSTFTVLFPATITGVKPDEPLDAPTRPDANQTVLVVDDEPTVKDVASRMLEAAGFKVLLAANGRDGISVLREHGNDIAVVLLDLTMPGLSGQETFHEMREICPEVRVVLTSGYSEQDALSDFTGDDIAGFIQKPYRSADLSQVVYNALTWSRPS